MKKKIAILSVLILIGMPLIAVDIDADDSDTKTIKICTDTLYHSTATAIEDWSVTGMVWIYPLGEDSSMKKYISDPQNNNIRNGVSSVKKGVSYEVYFYSYDAPRVFDYKEAEIALKPYNYEIPVKDKSVVKLKVDSLKSGTSKYNSFEVIYMPNKTLSIFGIVGTWITLNHVDDDGYYTFEVWYDDAPYMEAEIEILVKEFHGSPYLYIGLCIGITALVALLIAVCGRKPKL